MRLYNSPARPVVFTAVVVIVMDAGILRVKSTQLLRSFLGKKCRFTRSLFYVIFRRNRKVKYNENVGIYCIGEALEG